MDTFDPFEVPTICRLCEEVRCRRSTRACAPGQARFYTSRVHVLRVCTRRVATTCSGNSLPHHSQHHHHHHPTTPPPRAPSDQRVRLGGEAGGSGSEGGARRRQDIAQTLTGSVIQHILVKFVLVKNNCIYLMLERSVGVVVTARCHSPSPSPSPSPPPLPSLPSVPREAILDAAVPRYS